VCTTLRGSVERVVRIASPLEPMDFPVFQLSVKLTINAPGRKAASTKPRKKRVATMPAKLWVTPERVETIPQRSMMIEMYSDGRLMVLMNIFEGTCIKM
jgi:hypothetical protein